jgi:hypothetical protein
MLLSTGFLETIEPRGLPDGLIRALIDSRIQKSEKFTRTSDENTLLAAVSYTLSTAIFKGSRITNRLNQSDFRLDFSQNYFGFSESSNEYGLKTSVSINGMPYRATLIQEELLSYWMLKVENVPLEHETGVLYGQVSLQSHSLPLSLAFVTASMAPYLVSREFLADS